ncbi:MAG: hypothetical protein FJ279_10555 [Planctomycetes bacterium]|nr:hypothetical protein [Planctomycetota bacterium]
MTPKQRVIAALQHREPDRVPWGEWQYDHNVVSMIIGRETFIGAKFRLTKAYWDGRRDEIVESFKRDEVDFIRGLPLDLVHAPLVPPRGHKPAAMKQLDAETYEDAAGNLHRISATTGNLLLYRQSQKLGPEPTLDSLVYRPPAPPDQSEYELARHLIKELGQTHFIALRGPALGWPLVGRTPEERYMSLAEKPDLCRRVAENSGRAAIERLRQLDLTGVDGIFSGADYSHNLGPFASPKFFRELILPHLQEMARYIHSKGLFWLYHACGNNWALMDLFVEAGFDAYQAIQASAGMDMKLLKERYGHKLAFIGGVKNENLILGRPDDVRADALYALKHGAPGGGYIYGASHSLAVGAKPANLDAMRRTLADFGAYPIRVPDEN